MLQWYLLRLGREELNSQTPTRVLELLRRHHRLGQHAVDAVADDGALLERLDVDVGGPRLDPLIDDQVHQLDDRGLFAPLGDRGQVDDLVLGLVLLEGELGVLRVLEQVGQLRLAGVVDLVDRALDLRLERQGEAQALRGYARAQGSEGN